MLGGAHLTWQSPANSDLQMHLAAGSSFSLDSWSFQLVMSCCFCMCSAFLQGHCAPPHVGGLGRGSWSALSIAGILIVIRR